MSKNYIILLAGGKGKRVWPFSLGENPKQFFIKIKDKSLFHISYDRIKDLPIEEIIITTNAIYQYVVNKNIFTANIHNDFKYTVYLESEFKDNFISTIVAAFKIAEKNGNMLMLPTDQYIKNLSMFDKDIEDVFNIDIQDKILLLGTDIRYMTTEFGYVQKGNIIDRSKQLYNVKSFIEKPKGEVASKYYQTGEYLWNVGIVYCNARSYLEHIKHCCYDYYDCAYKLYHNLEKGEINNSFILNKELLDQIKPQSINDVFLTKVTEKLLLKRANFDFIDLGNLDNLVSFYKKQNHNNVKNYVGGNKVYNSKTKDKDFFYNSSNIDIIYSDNYIFERLICSINVKDLLIYSNNNLLFITNKYDLDDTQKILKNLDKEAYQKLNIFKEFHKPWGYYEIILEKPNFLVKKIIIFSNHKTSLQCHKKRTETITVVEGKALVINNKKKHYLKKGEAIFIDIGDKHQLINIGKKDLELLEVQCSKEAISEDDIVRINDPYNRK